MRPNTPWRACLKAVAALTVLVSLVSGVVACNNGATTPPATTTPTTPVTPPTPANPEVILATTTSTRDSGLLDVLLPIFEQKTGYKVKTIAVGSGQAIAMGERGEADVILAHSAAAEIKSVTAGFGVNRKLVMHNNFMIVGPASDPAGIKNAASVVEAYKKIADAKAIFVSRGDNSGTDVAEKAIWVTAGITAKGQSWYQETGQGMGATLTIASEKGGYTYTDDGTFLAARKNLNLVTLYMGDKALLNVYHVYQVNPDKWQKVNAAGAKAFVDFLVSTDTQKTIGEYGVEKFGQTLFTPDAGKTDAELGSQ